LDEPRDTRGIDPIIGTRSQRNIGAGAELIRLTPHIAIGGAIQPRMGVAPLILRGPQDERRWLLAQAGRGGACRTSRIACAC